MDNLDVYIQRSAEIFEEGSETYLPNQLSEKLKSLGFSEDSQETSHIEMTISNEIRGLKTSQESGTLTLNHGINMIRKILMQVPESENLITLLNGVSVEGLVGHH